MKTKSPNGALMSKTELQHVRAVLEAINEWYESSNEGPYASSLLMDDDRGLKEHIAQALAEVSR